MCFFGFILKSKIFDSVDELLLFGFVQLRHLIDIVVELFLEDKDLVEQKLFLLGFDPGNSIQAFLLILLSFNLQFFDLVLILYYLLL